jgi:hypothetical protein
VQAALAFPYQLSDGDGRDGSTSAPDQSAVQPRASKFSLTLDRSSEAFFEVVVA